MILPLTSDCTLHDVKAVACPGLAKNWISSSIVAKFNFTVHSSANMEYVEWKGKRLQSTKYVEVTWTLKDVNKTSKEDFMVVQGSVGFDMLVTPKSCEFLRGPATSVRAHN
ncbi:hypothetical protein F4820DRAFT_428634 [Hypoxylon rubiginosum]|uniref:Uncharacterized protein n=1 Tax=Hypoxylon rubiginosum TaxID=110542 RepID=A0ACB9YVA5_9PEZI|nr:hypothetical protein F4820DRAFT_428634 [Hypoxylon rubiginosum]